MEKEIELRAGTHQIPVLHTPENWMIADTTPLLGLLDSRFPLRRLFPSGPRGILVHLVEEYFDEWIARVMVHYRWNYPNSADYVSRQIGDGDDQVASLIRIWGGKACRATGTGTLELGQAAEDEYKRLLSAMETQLGHSSYLLGNRPTAADCAALGGLYAHILNDPDPLILIQDYPGVIAWAETQKGPISDSVWAEGEVELTPFAEHVLKEMAESYCPFVLGNSEALNREQKSFISSTFGIEASYLTRAYPEQSRAMLVQRINDTLGEDEKLKVEKRLVDFGLAECFSPSRCANIINK